MSVTMQRQKIVQKDGHEITAMDVLVGTGATSHSFEIYRQVRQTRLQTGNYNTCRKHPRGGEVETSTDCSLRIETTEKKKKPKTIGGGGGGNVKTKPPPQRTRYKRKRVQGSKLSDCPKERKRKITSEWQ